MEAQKSKEGERNPEENNATGTGEMAQQGEELAMQPVT